MKFDNSASRLLAILEAGKQHKPEAPCLAVWDSLLNANGDRSVLLARLGHVCALPRKAIQELKDAYPEQGDTWSHWESQVTTALMVQNVHQKWESFIANIDTHTMTYLRMASQLLDAKRGSQLLREEELLKVRQSIQEAMDEALSANLPIELQKQVVRCLRNILAALDEYRITGVVAVLEAAESALGHAAVDSEYRSFLLDNKLGQKIFDGISAAANLMTISQGLPALSVAITGLIK